MHRDHLLTRIQALLSKTEAKGASEAEAASSLAKAQQLMDEHNIALGEVIAREPISSKGSAVTFEEAEAWTSDTLHSHFFAPCEIVREVFGVETVITKYRLRGGNRVVRVKISIFGEQSAVPSAIWALNYLGPLFRRFWDRYRVQNQVPSSEMMIYYTGLVEGFLAKTRAAKNDRHSPGHVMGEIEHNRRQNCLAVLKDTMRQSFEAKHPDVKELIKKVTGNADTLEDGIRDGHKIDLNRPLESRPSPALAAAPKALPSR